MESLLSHLFHNYQREQLICANSPNWVCSRSVSLPHYAPTQHAECCDTWNNYEQNMLIREDTMCATKQRFVGSLENQ